MTWVCPMRRTAISGSKILIDDECMRLEVKKQPHIHSGKNLKVTFKQGYGILDFCHSDRGKPANSQVYASKSYKSQSAVYRRCNLCEIFLFSSNIMDRRARLFLVKRTAGASLIRHILVLCVAWWSGTNSSHGLCCCLI